VIDGAVPPAPFGEILRESLWPKTLVGRIAMGLVALKPLLIWVLPQLLLGEPAEVTALYRPNGDIQYLQVVGALSRGNLGESNLLETAGQGLDTFPFVPLVLHALSYGVLGTWGLLLADVLAYYAFAAAVVVTLRLALLPERAARLFSLWVVALGPMAVSYLIRHSGLTFAIGGERFPRPLLAETFLLAPLCVCSLLLQGRDVKPARLALAGGVTLGLLAQFDVYGAFIAAQVFGLSWLFATLKVPRAARPAFVAWGGVAVLVMIVTLAPFLLQRATGHPDLARRFGVQLVPRSAALGWFGALPLGVPVGVSALAFGCVEAGRRFVSRDAARPLALASLQWVPQLWLAYFALPLFGLVLGQALHLYLFEDRFFRFASYALSIVLLHVGVIAAERLVPWPRRRALLGNIATLVFLTCMGAAILGRGYQRTRWNQHMRADFFGQAHMHDYRPLFTDLVRELERPSYRNVVVLGTFDHQLQSYWQTFRGGHSFNPDPFASTAPDSVVERRVMALCAAIGMSADDFEKVARERWLNIFWLSVAKYSANRGYQPFPRNQYTGAELAKIDSVSVLKSWETMVPRSELARLRRSFVEVAPNWDRVGRLDAIVLTDDADFARFVPDPAHFRLSFRNAAFRVFVRAGAGG
jgi:hypothetical protein